MWVPFSAGVPGIICPMWSHRPNAACHPAESVLLKSNLKSYSCIVEWIGKFTWCFKTGQENTKVSPWGYSPRPLGSQPVFSNLDKEIQVGLVMCYSPWYMCTPSFNFWHRRFLLRVWHSLWKGRLPLLLPCPLSSTPFPIASCWLDIFTCVAYCGLEINWSTTANLQCLTITIKLAFPITLQPF